MSDPGLEPVDVVDEQDRVVGRVTRAEMRAGNLLHRCASVLCANSSGQIYVHRRTITKDVYPGLFDVFAGGVLAAGESYLEAARRELSEELGVEGPEPEFLFTHRYEAPVGRSFTALYRVTWDGPIRHQPSEVTWGAFVRLEEVLEMIEERDFCPDSLELFRRLLDEGRV